MRADSWRFVTMDRTMKMTTTRTKTAVDAITKAAGGRERAWREGEV